VLVEKGGTGICPWQPVAVAGTQSVASELAHLDFSQHGFLVAGREVADAVGLLGHGAGT